MTDYAREVPTLMSYTQSSTAVEPWDYRQACNQPKFKNLLNLEALKQQERGGEQKLKKKMEKKMSGKRVVQVFIVDPDENIPQAAALLYQSEQKFTDLTDQELFFEVDIKPILDKHNKLRHETLDKKSTNRAGRDVFLESARIRDLKMVVSTIAEF